LIVEIIRQRRTERGGWSLWAESGQRVAAARPVDDRLSSTPRASQAVQSVLRRARHIGYCPFYYDAPSVWLRLLTTQVRRL
jgi:hypothetical protein